MEPELFTTVLGLQDEHLSDAVLEIWIDSKSYRVVKQTAELFGANVNGVRTHVTLVMDLVETDIPYGIQPPQ
jgi:hypothetical protein